MSHINTTTGVEEGTPAIPAEVRTVAYFVGLGVGAVAMGASLIAPIWADPALAEQISSTANAAGTVMGFIVAGLGVIYRPTR